ncbi:MAG TPA: M48 family metalloprotease [Gemmataceae bacterium]|nr:M48 family metalloprotease [Gemmataceae bacterium]
MTRRVWPLILALLAVGGCLPEDGSLATVSSSLFDTAPEKTPAGRLIHAPASEEAAKRVLQVGGKILVSNPNIGVRPVFSTIGAPWEEIFHQDDKAVFITEGLVRECRTDGQLAAVLCHELGKMEAERHERAAPPPDHGPPMAVPVGTDYGGAFGPPDGTRAMELAVYERKRLKQQEAAAAPLDPDAIAQALLDKAGGNPADWQAVVPLLRAADEHMEFEKPTPK